MRPQYDPDVAFADALALASDEIGRPLSDKEEATLAELVRLLAAAKAAMDRGVTLEALEAVLAEFNAGASCVECLRTWDDESERWRSFLTVDGEAALYCPECAEKEFAD